MRRDIIKKVEKILKLNRIHLENASPNTVNYYANLYGIELTSEEVVVISDKYK